jgi:uncharacterized protein
MLRARFQEEMKTAMKAKDAVRTSTIRLIIAELKMKDIEVRTQGHDSEGVGEGVILSMLENMLKKRAESAVMYRQGGRPELAAKEEAESAIIRSYLPAPLSDEGTREAIDTAIKTTGAQSLKDMGAVMTYLKEQHAGQIDFSKVSGLVRAALGAS